MKTKFLFFLLLLFTQAHAVTKNFYYSTYRYYTNTLVFGNFTVPSGISIKDILEATADDIMFIDLFEAGGVVDGEAATVSDLAGSSTASNSLLDVLLKLSSSPPGESYTFSEFRNKKNSKVAKHKFSKSNRYYFLLFLVLVGFLLWKLFSSK